MFQLMDRHREITGHGSFDGVIGRSKRLGSFKEALLYMGKSNAAIEKCIVWMEAELRYRGHSEDKISLWKTWV